MLKNDGGGDPDQAQINSDVITAAVNAALTPLNEKLSKLETQLQANAESELKTKRDAVKAKFSFMTEAAVNSLSGDALNDLYSQCQTSTGLNPAFQGMALRVKSLTWRHLNNGSRTSFPYRNRGPGP